MAEESTRQRSDRMRECNDYRKHLDRQITEKARHKRFLEEREAWEAERERQARVEQEEEERSCARDRDRELRTTTKRNRLMLEDVRMEYREVEREIQARQDQWDWEHVITLDQRSLVMRRMRREQAEKRERVQLEVSRMIREAETRKREREQLLFDLVQDEIKCELEIRVIEQALRREKIREDLATALREQMLLAERKKELLLAEDRLWAREVMDKVMEDENLAKLTAEARRRMRIQYREDLDKLIAQRRRIREEESARMGEKKIAKKMERLGLAEREATTEKRRQLLAKHASHVASYVNKALLTSEEEEILADLPTLFIAKFGCGD